MNDKEIRKAIKEAKPTLRCVAGGKGVYLRISDSGTVMGFTLYNKQKGKVFNVGPYGMRADEISLDDIGDEAVFRMLIKEGKDPILSVETKLTQIDTFDEVAQDWIDEISKRLKHPDVPKRIYNKDIKPKLGEFKISDIRKPDVVSLVREIRDSGRPTIAADVLIYCKQIIDHAETLGLVDYNVALSIKRVNLV